MSIRKVVTFIGLGMGLCFSMAQADTWQMKQKDPYHTGRADYTVPANRLNGSFFDVFLWQKPSPDSPDNGNFNGSSMPFFDGVGPENSDIVVGTYHWPKGVQGMNRHTGRTFWYGNPDGGEYIATSTPAFSADGSTIYVVNDFTESGASLMAFAATDGPSGFWGNQYDNFPEHFGYGSPVIHGSGVIFGHGWGTGPYGAWDDGLALYEVWTSEYGSNLCFSDPTLYEMYVIVSGRQNEIRVYDDTTGSQVWSVDTGYQTDMTPTVDPNTGNIYVAVGGDDIYVVGLDIDGNPLWSSTALQVYDYQDGVNSPQRATASGCLSHDGSTYYFQTVAEDGSGQLYAVNTTDGSVKWTYETQSKGWEGAYSSPIVTENNVILVGSNENGTYYALLDNGYNDVVLLDALSVLMDSYNNTSARASATLSADGLLYLPLRTYWSAGNGDGQAPTFSVENLFGALDLNADARILLYPPGGQRAFAGNGFVELKWTAIQDPAGVFDRYAIYRDTAAFESVEGMTPIADVNDLSTVQYTDAAAQNGTSYYYAITTITTQGAEIKTIQSVGPRTPRDETDLQVVSITRTPFYPRFCVDYTAWQATEESGFGPYWVSAATGLCDGQNENTKHEPDMNENMTYTATVRNRGTNIFADDIQFIWEVDGQVVAGLTLWFSLAPGETGSFQIDIPWDNEFHDIQFTIVAIDDRPENNTLESNTLAVGFLTYIDESFIEKFREEWSANWPAIQTDDLIDWLNMHRKRFNELFEDAGSSKRVHYDVLEILEDQAADPASPAAIHFAVFPFRYHWDTDGDPRLSGYYHPEEDIDYGLLHEMGHQLGMIDIYQLDLTGEQNQVNGQSYSAHADLMHGCDPMIGEFHALAMDHWLTQPHGYYGQYLYNLPQTIQLRLLDYEGQPLDGATVKVYQMCDREGQGKVIPSQIKAQGTTDPDGLFTLPNVPIDPNLVPPIATGDTLRANPFGYVHVVGTNGVLLIRVEHESGVDYCWLDITECCVAYWNGQTDTTVFERSLALGGPVMQIMPKDLAELTAYDWVAWAEGASASVEDDIANKRAGAGSVRFITDGGFDTYLRYPKTYTAVWDLSDATELHIWFYAENTHSFQSESPWIRLQDAEGNYFEYAYYEGGNRADFLNIANYNWSEAVIPLDGSFVDDGWNRTAVHGTPDLAHIQMVEIHADTWDYGFDLWVDDVRFNWPEFKYRDFATDGLIDLSDLEILASHWLAASCLFADCQGADLTQDQTVNLDDFELFAEQWLAY